MIGASTGLNSMAWARASKEEYDAWQTLTDDPQWSWNGLQPYLRKVESVYRDESSNPPQTSSASYDSAFEGFEGPVSVSSISLTAYWFGCMVGPQASYNGWYSDPFRPYQDALQSFGIPVNTSPVRYPVAFPVVVTDHSTSG